MTNMGEINDVLSEFGRVSARIEKLLVASAATSAGKDAVTALSDASFEELRDAYDLLSGDERRRLAKSLLDMANARHGTAFASGDGPGEDTMHPLKQVAYNQEYERQVAAAERTKDAPDAGHACSCPCHREGSPRADHVCVHCSEQPHLYAAYTSYHDVEHACAPDWRTVPGSNTALCRTCGKSADVVLRSGPSATTEGTLDAAWAIVEGVIRDHGENGAKYPATLTGTIVVALDKAGFAVRSSAPSQPTPERQESERERLARQNEDDDGF